MMKMKKVTEEDQKKRRKFWSLRSGKRDRNRLTKVFIIFHSLNYHSYQHLSQIKFLASLKMTAPMMIMTKK